MLRLHVFACLEGLTVTEANPSGFAGVDLDTGLLAASKLHPGEWVWISSGGAPPIRGILGVATRGSGTVRVRGGIAVPVGAKLDLAAECLLVEREALLHEPRVVRVDERNQPMG